MKNKWMRAIVMCVLVGAQTAWAAESGTLLKADELKAEPFRDAKTVKSLAAGEKVEIASKDGGWFKVKAGKSSGWVRMLSIRKGDAKQGASNASGLLALTSGRAGTGKVVATTGIRGLNEEELKAAKFDAAEIQLAESYAVKKSDAQLFAKQGKLVPRQFEYLSEVK
jgi:uncharacterized protein YgiM (DUF1202 family)